MLSQIAVAGVDIRLVTVRFSHATAQIIGHQDLRCAAEKSKASDVRAQPVGQFLRPGGLGKGVAGGAEDSAEDLRLTDLAGLPVDDRRCLPGVIDEQLFASTMLLAHDHVDLGGPKAVMLAEPAVLEALRVSESIFLPEQGQSDAGTAQLGMDMSPVRHRTLITGHIGRRRKKMPLQLGVGQHRRPGQAAGSKAIEVFTDAGSTYLQAGSNLAGRQADLEFET
ncbi:hypothetical protein BV346_05405 [Pseudomonas syringae pv. actinidiae]|nr:hypothetical protein BV346_05405 [Pseudomonas syringae pv. actinidiae]OSR83081.1 hypothetical protein BV331_05514 [Pseudomonas syringae pv. actinidiae]OSR98966.1 hypothetical protein BV333_05462 [Pseudomonas syringae pv. actinidiae]OSS01178.1 hypothetical protein BV334_05479 [Pseudomonas syringae pv. actinidiae]OSS12150.1 hypothetical protein BV335_05469 [Pseudomonas syringae pv. actinidiae]